MESKDFHRILLGRCPISRKVPHPPQHRIDAPIIYVPPDDEAWDSDKIQKESVELKKKKETHPVIRYFAGETRFDIGAENVSSYLDSKKQPEKWKLRRLGFQDFYEVRDLLLSSVVNKDDTLAREARRNACRYGIESVENGPELEFDRNGRLTDDTMDRLRELNDNLPEELGQAVWAASQSLTEAEAKVSAS